MLVAVMGQTDVPGDLKRLLQGTEHADATPNVAKNESGIGADLGSQEARGAGKKKKPKANPKPEAKAPRKAKATEDAIHGGYRHA